MKVVLREKGIFEIRYFINWIKEVRNFFETESSYNLYGIKVDVYHDRHILYGFLLKNTDPPGKYR